MAFYIPSHDMLVSVLMEVRFDQSGSVRTRSFEVLPFQIYIAGNSEDPYVQQRASLIRTVSLIRGACSIFTFLLIILKIRYRLVIGNGTVAKSVVRDLL